MSNWIQQNYPDEVVPDTDNPHHAAAFERRKAREAVQALVGRAYAFDVGGRPDAYPNCFACCPLAGPEDYHRNNRYEDYENWCVHKEAECTCAPVFDVVTSCHSLYYIPPSAWARRVHQSRSKTGYAIVHMFDQISDSWYGGEYQYTRDGGRVECHVRGNLTAYSHDACDWLRLGYWSDGTMAMAWQAVKTLKHCVVLAFTAAAPGLQAGVPTRTFDGALRDEKDYGMTRLETTRATFISRLVEADLRTTDAYSCGNWLAVLGVVGTRRVIIPKALLNRAAVAALGLDRTAPAAWSSHLNAVKGYARDYNTLPGDPSLTILYAAAISFTANAEQEAAITEGLRWHARVFRRLAAARAMIAVPFSRRWLYALVLCLICGLTVAEVPVAANYGVASLAWLNFPPLALLLWFLARRWRYTRGILDAQRLLLAARANAPEGRLIASAPGPVPLPAHESEKALRQPREGAAVQELLLTTPPRQSGGGVVVGVQPLASVPVVSAVSTGNELRAVCNRATMEVPEPSPFEWKAFERWVFDNFDDLFPYTKPVRPWEFERWVSRFPAPKQKRLRAAHARLLEHPELVDAVSTYLIKAFGKRETLLRTNGGEFEDYDPRLIQGFSDEYNCITGPWTVAYSERMAKQWGPDHVVWYPCHATAEELGAWLCDDPTDGELVVEGDESRYDAHLHKRSLKLLARIRRAHNPPREVQRAFDRVDGVKRGYTQGVAYTVKATRASGDTRTSVDNAVLKGLMCLYSAARCWGYHCRIERGGEWLSTLPTVRHLREARVRAKIRGDDSVIRMGEWSSVDTALFQPLSRRLGFELEPKFHKDLDFVTFCSGRYWPVGPTRVWGPMPGRTLCKLGTTLTNPRNHMAHVRGVAMCYVREASYVPFLGPWVSMLLRLTEGSMSDDIQVWRARAARTHSVDGDAALMVEKVYGLDYRLALPVLAAMCDEVRELPSVMSHEILTALVRADMA